MSRWPSGTMSLIRGGKGGALIRPYERDEQVLFFQWLNHVRIDGRELRPHVFAIPNGGHRIAPVAMKLKAEGVTAGICDLFIRLACGGKHGLFIEMKRMGEGATEQQLDFILASRERGYGAEICEGFENARRTTTRYLAHDFTVTDRWVG